MEISRIAADTFAVPMAAAAKGKGKKQEKASPQAASAQTAKPGKGKNGFKLPFARNKGEF